MRKRIAVLFHEADRNRDLSGYLISLFSRIWREEGFEVRFVYGPRDHVPADLAILHVDLSVVPEEYLALADRYPRSLNRRMTDIRKRRISGARFRDGDEWSGPVIVKSDLNHAGGPEEQLRLRTRRWYVPRLLRGRPERVREYRIYPSIDAVPQEDRRNPRLVIDKVLPERDGDRYCIRLYHFLGDRATCSKLISDEPVIRARGNWSLTHVEPDPEIVRIREEFGADFGKFDYVMHDGAGVLIDANKTPGGTALEPTPERMARWRERAAGIRAYL